MDAFAQLALMAKAKLVFESADTFLSFPALSPLSFPPERLQFCPGEVTAENLAEQTEFALIVNQIPRGVLAPLEQTEYLWNVYADVLKTAHVAAGALGEQEKSDLSRAVGFLYETTADGFRKDGAALTTYRQYRDATFAVQEDYKNQQYTAEASDDPIIKARWREGEEPRLRAEIKRLEEGWVTKGFKAEVEAALQIEQASAARAPALTWSDWRKSYIEDLDNATDTSLVESAVTSYSPNDIFHMDNWPRFTLSRPEIERLIRDAPSELKEIFESGSGPVSSIDSLSFQYRSVAVIRPWFRQGLFKSRFWRLPSNAEMLSDGVDLSSGRCPAYISALVFARSIEIKSKQHVVDAPPGTGPKLFGFPPGSVKTKVSMARQLATIVRNHRTRAAADATVKIRDHRAGQFGQLPRRGAVVVPTRRARTPQKPAAVEVPSRRSDTAPIPAPPPQHPRPAGPANEEIMILAFICKRVPRCPDPDPGLSWV